MRYMSDATGTGRLRVLVIDDSPQILAYLRELLSADECDVTTISDPHEGLERLRRKNERWHILILDLEMPDMPGLRLLEKLRQIDGGLAVITLTEHATTQSTSDAIKLDVSAYMHKPFSGDDMRNTIARVARKQGIMVRAEDRLYVMIGRGISQLRQSKRVALNELSRRTDLSQSLLSQIERAEKPPSLSDVFRIARALEVPLSQLVAVDE
ncbi:putative transcriptional regulatory protein TcrX [Enhygromyxa salina]|uniref:Putative transcriptional regulatory protein TcrX n=2 Tax=Enhygromyxa salina TaxID=215803 RepID=A0A2S9YJZ3_9BACT|nr:putative transcriptional regulatory protein TcrX [Enhygromyxa salina]